MTTFARIEIFFQNFSTQKVLKNRFKPVQITFKNSYLAPFEQIRSKHLKFGWKSSKIDLFQQIYSNKISLDVRHSICSQKVVTKKKIFFFDIRYQTTKQNIKILLALGKFLSKITRVRYSITFNSVICKQICLKEKESKSHKVTPFNSAQKNFPFTHVHRTPSHGYQWENSKKGFSGDKRERDEKSFPCTIFSKWKIVFIAVGGVSKRKMCIITTRLYTCNGK